MQVVHVEQGKQKEGESMNVYITFVSTSNHMEGDITYGIKMDVLPRIGDSIRLLDGIEKEYTESGARPIYSVVFDVIWDLGDGEIDEICDNAFNEGEYSVAIFCDVKFEIFNDISERWEPEHAKEDADKLNCKIERLIRRWVAKSASLQGKANGYDESASMHASFVGGSWAVWDKANGGINSMTAEFARGMAHGMRMAADELKANSDPRPRR